MRHGYAHLAISGLALSHFPIRRSPGMALALVCSGVFPEPLTTLAEDCPYYYNDGNPGKHYLEDG